MNGPSLVVTNPLSVRLLRRVVLLGAMLAVLIASGRAWYEYQAMLDGTRAVMAQIERSHAKTLATSLWDFDIEQVKTQLEGIRDYPHINYAAVEEPNGSVTEAGLRRQADALTTRIPLTRRHENRDVPLGSLVLQTDLAQARAQAFEAALASAGFSGLLVVLVSAALFMLTRNMVSRHIATAAAHFQTARMAGPDSRLPQLKLDKSWSGDELDILSIAVNHMQENLMRSHAQAWLAEREARSQARFPEENPNPVLRISAEGLITQANPASRELLEHLGTGLGQRLPQPYSDQILDALLTNQTRRLEIPLGERLYDFVARPIEQTACVNLYGMDVTERKEALDAIRRSLFEKEILLKEIHHRVKNNLQIISSLLFLQMEYVADPADRVLFSESQRRIQAMALVHEELYGTRDLSRVDMRDYVPRLVERVVSSAAGPVDMAVDVDEVLLPVTRSIPCGLLLNELVMNAVKHAFTSGPERGDSLRVSLKRGDGLLTLRVEDNGPGLPPDFDIAATPTLGMTLVTSLARQLGGGMTAENQSRGARFTLRFPEEE